MNKETQTDNTFNSIIKGGCVLKSKGQLFSSVFTIFFCIVAFALMAFFSLKENTLPALDTESKIERTAAKGKKGILFNFPFDSVFLGFDFDMGKTNVLLLGAENPEEEILENGYFADITVTADYTYLADLIDCFGGIETTNGGETLRLTGVQVTDILKSGAESCRRKEFTEKILKNVALGRFTAKQLSNLIESTETGLSFPEGYDLLDGIKSAANEINFISEVG